jgi:hypothetical protein
LDEGNLMGKRKILLENQIYTQFNTLVLNTWKAKVLIVPAQLDLLPIRPVIIGIFLH